MSVEKKSDGNAQEGWVRYSSQERVRRNSRWLLLICGVGLAFFVFVLKMHFIDAFLLIGAIFAVVLFIRSRYPAQWFCPEGHEVFKGQSYCTQCGKKAPCDERISNISQ